MFHTLTTPFCVCCSVGVQEMLECLCKLLSTTGKKLEELADVRPTSFSPSPITCSPPVLKALADQLLRFM